MTTDNFVNVQMMCKGKKIPHNARERMKERLQKNKQIT